MLNKRKIGSQIESYAENQIKKAGYIIVENNFLCPLGEIDIIAQNNNCLVFIEVRYRRKDHFGGASASVDLRKQNKLIKTASLYLQQKKLTNKIPCRFDVFALQGELKNLTYNWIKNAFTA